LIDTITCDTAGTQKQLLETIRKFDTGRVVPYLVCLWSSAWMESNDLPCRCCVLGYKGFLKANLGSVVASLADFIDRHDCDIVQTFFEDALFIGLLGKMRSRRKPKLLGSRRDMGLGGDRPWYHALYAVAKPFVNIGFNGILANSEAVRDYVSRTEFVPKSRIAVIRNGIDMPVGDRGRPALINHRPGQVAFCIAASLTPIKRHDVFFRACRVVGEQVGMDRFCVYCLGDGPLHAELKELLDRLALGDVVTLAGVCQDVSAVLAHCDAGVLCSDREGLSNAILEYMAAGLPVIATDVGGNRELVDQTNGFVVPRGDPARLAEAMVRLIRDGALRSSLAAASRRRVATQYSWDRTLKQTLAFYEHLVSDSVTS
jgi:glycosyltransferase involved in cell wall biosynthesis